MMECNRLKKLVYIIIVLAKRKSNQWLVQKQDLCQKGIQWTKKKRFAEIKIEAKREQRSNKKHYTEKTSAWQKVDHRKINITHYTEMISAWPKGDQRKIRHTVNKTHKELSAL